MRIDPSQWIIDNAFFSPSLRLASVGKKRNSGLWLCVEDKVKYLRLFRSVWVNAAMGIVLDVRTMLRKESSIGQWCSTIV